MNDDRHRGDEISALDVKGYPEILGACWALVENSAQPGLGAVALLNAALVCCQSVFGGDRLRAMLLTAAENVPPDQHPAGDGAQTRRLQ